MRSHRIPLASSDSVPRVSLQPNRARTGRTASHNSPIGEWALAMNLFSVRRLPGLSVAAHLTSRVCAWTSSRR